MKSGLSCEFLAVPHVLETKSRGLSAITNFLFYWNWQEFVQFWASYQSIKGLFSKGKIKIAASISEPDTAAWNATEQTA